MSLNHVLGKPTRVFVLNFTNGAIHNELVFSSHSITSGFRIFTPTWTDNNACSLQLLVPPLLLTTLRSPFHEYRRLFKKKSFTCDRKEAKYEIKILVRGAHKRGMLSCRPLPSHWNKNRFCR